MKTETEPVNKRMGRVAGVVAAQFERIKRNEPTPGLSDGILVRKAPYRTTDDWVTDLCHKAHGEMFPDDWRYELIVDALGDIEEMAGEWDDLDADDFREKCSDTLTERFDGRYVYTAQLTGWLHSRADRYGYVDEWTKEISHADDLTRDLAGGLWTEYQEVFWSVFESIRAHVEG